MPVPLQRKDTQSSVYPKSVRESSLSHIGQHGLSPGTIIPAHCSTFQSFRSCESEPRAVKEKAIIEGYLATRMVRSQQRTFHQLVMCCWPSSTIRLPLLCGTGDDRRTGCYVHTACSKDCVQGRAFGRLARGTLFMPDDDGGSVSSKPGAGVGSYSSHSSRFLWTGFTG